MAARLRSHLELCRQLLDIAENEARVTHLDALEAENQARMRRETLLPKLVESLADLRLVRAAWQQFTAEERASQPEILSLLRENQDLIMKIMVIDRENEQGMLKQGRVPARHLPSIGRQRPQIAADLYKFGARLT